MAPGTYQDRQQKFSEKTVMKHQQKRLDCYSVLTYSVSLKMKIRCNAVKSFTLYPWIHQWTNNTYTEDQTASCKFPDVNPAELPPNSNFSMAAGDFLEIYTDPDTFDCVATVFFIDTAHCIISYIETIYNILKPGGYWINLGPLLYHYSDIPNEVSIELSYEELKKVIKQVGFVIQREEKDVRSTYTQNPKSMLRYEYSSVFFTAQKPVS